jgi:glycosyltransferase involved in cell wall biosynthesis
MDMTSSPLVSVVTPSFNQGSFIAETISSVLGQDYPFIEYLVVDGGSTDDSLDILRNLGEHVRWISEPDRGQADAINKGWRRTRGDVVAWLNADDLYRPGAVARVVAFLCDHPDVDLVYGDCDYIDKRGGVVGRHPTRPADIVDLLASAVNFIPQPATFLRRRVFETVGGLDENLHYVMDFEYWLRVGIQRRIAYMPGCLAGFRWHEDSKTSTHSAQMGDELCAMYRRLFASGILPRHLQRLERPAMSNAFYAAAGYQLSAGNVRRARQYAFEAWRCWPWRPRRMLLKTLVPAIRGPLCAVFSRLADRAR